MRTILSGVVGALILLVGMSAQALETPLWNCRVHGNVSGYSIGIGIGGKYLRGPGEVSCDSLTGGQARHIPVMLKFYGAGLALDFTRIRSLHIVSTMVGVAGGPEDLIGTYSLGANVGATVFNTGVAVDAAVGAYNESLSFQLGFQSEDAVGLGVRALGRYFSITAM